MKKLNNNTQRIKFLTGNAMFAALAFVSVLLIKIPGIGGFLSMDFKDVFITIAAMFFGPVSAVVISVIVGVLELTISSTGIYGMIMNILGSVSFSLVASLIYKYKKTLLGAIIGLVCGSAVMVSVMLAANLFITPLYMGISTKDVAMLIPKLLMPFNVVKGILNATLTLMLYKPLTKLFRRFGVRRINEFEAHNEVKTNRGSSNRSAWIFVISILIVAATLYILLKIFGGQVAFMDFLNRKS